MQNRDEAGFSLFYYYYMFRVQNLAHFCTCMEMFQYLVNEPALEILTCIAYKVIARQFGVWTRLDRTGGREY